MTLRMSGCTVLNIRDMKKFFSLKDALRSHAEFAAFAMRHAACMGDMNRVAAILFALHSLRQRQRMMEVDVRTIPGIVQPERLRELLGASLTEENAAHAHWKALAACLTNNTITLRMFDVCGKTVKEAARYCLQSDRVAVDRMCLMVMTVCALKLAGRTWESVMPGTLEDALLDIKPPHSCWTSLPPADSLTLPGRKKPYSLQLHPAVKAAPAMRVLPHGCRLHTICLAGAEGGRADVTLKYDEQGDAQACCSLAEGEHILLDAMRDADGKVWALRFRQGSDAWARHINGIACSGECGTITLQNGLPDGSQCLNDWVRDDYLETEWEQPAVNIAVQGCEVLLHMADGTVHSSYPSREAMTNVLFLEDILNTENGGEHA